MSHPATSLSATGSQLGGARALGKAEQRKSFVAAVSGNYLEWFDWTTYAVFTPYIAASFFENSNPTSATLATLGVFAGGFVARPVGGLVFGRIGDKLGRKFALVTAMVCMGIGSLAIALMPTFDQVGVWASVGLLLARLLQGLAHGGESGNAYSYIAEISPAKDRGLWGSSIFISATLGVMTATGLGALFSRLLAPEAMDSWGWRIAFVIGFLLAGFALVIRKEAQESEYFNEAKSDGSVDKLPATQKQLVIVAVRIFMLSTLTMVLYYTWMSFFATYAISSRGMDEQGAYTASLLAQVVGLIALPLWGRLSDKVGRVRQLRWWALAVMIVVFPVSLFLTEAPWTLFVCQSIALVVWAMQASIHPVVLAEQAPTAARSTSVGVWSSVGAALIGGTAPYLHAWFTAQGMEWAFSVYIIVLGVVTLIALRFIPDVTGLEMDQIPLPGEPVPAVK
ncbi:MFS transporter [Corynebacterium tapiri]|uniref:MFS transporter n=1 Tax=Corynebacterium tapiri TaxID=1448266 RepID=A0A5C4U5U6_9CORY|nr:MFS transporter [Corynebacterium tapiri]TNL98587.1 MFS transporter [Corynebacterium tapiri]